MRASLPLTLFFTASLAQNYALYARSDDLDLYDDDFSLTAREIWDNENDDLDLFIRDLLDDDLALFARTSPPPAKRPRLGSSSGSNKPLVGDLVLDHAKDQLKGHTKATDKANDRAISWGEKSAASRQAAIHAGAAGNTHQQSKQNARANFGSLLAGHYTAQADHHEAAEGRSQRQVSQMKAGGMHKYWEGR